MDIRGAPTMDGERIRLRDYLRRNTDALHRQLHHMPVFRRMSEGDLSAGSYRALMISLRDFYWHLDPEIERAITTYGHELDYGSYQPRFPFLAADVRALNGPPERAPRPRQNTNGRMAVTIRDLPSLIGVLYVVDGSMLGGAAINRLARAICPSETPYGRSYWQWCAKHGPLRWKATLGTIDASPSTDAFREKSLQAARVTFTALQAELQAETSNREAVAS
ncbi:MAG: biliverdin-producing heme oxygenase [Pseudomonadota bacterium]